MSKSSLLHFIRGLFMGIADVIPGVSGGTIAFITGIYQRLIHSLGELTDAGRLFFKGKFTKSLKKIDFSLFIPLFLGIAVSIFFFSKFIGILLESYTSATFAFFFGLILASALFIMKKIGKLRFADALSLVAGFVLAFIISINTSLNVSHSLPIVFVSAAIAICAMILPGISGAFILLLLGQYQYIIDALHSYDWTVIGVFLLGAITGLLVFSKLIDYVLRKYKSLTLSFLVGLMVGSLRIPFVQVTNNGGITLWVVLFGAIGFLAVFLLEGVFGKR